jgi:hypothetical protein
MRSSISRSLLSMAAWFYLGPFVAVAGQSLRLPGPLPFEARQAADIWCGLHHNRPPAVALMATASRRRAAAGDCRVFKI